MNLAKKPLMAAGMLAVSTAFVAAQPVINSVYPPSLTERVGDHVAFTALATGSPAPTYQWYFVSGGVTNLLTGQTQSSLIITNIQNTFSRFAIDTQKVKLCLMVAKG